MDASNLSVVGALLFLTIGVVVQGLLQRFLYPPLSRSYEKAKVTGRLRPDPVRIMVLARIINFIGLPLFGLFAGQTLIG